MKRKTRNQKHDEYVAKFGDIPVDYNERLSWLYDKLNISDKQAFNILNKKDMMCNSLNFIETQIVLFEVPEGTPRPRFRIVNRANISNVAMANPNFVHVYSLTGKEDNFDELFHDYDVLWAMACDVIDTMYKDMTKKEAVKAIDRIYNAVNLCWLAQGLC